MIFQNYDGPLHEKYCYIAIIIIIIDIIIIMINKWLDFIIDKFSWLNIQFISRVEI